LYEEDRAENELSVEQGFRILSAYELQTDTTAFVTIDQHLAKVTDLRVLYTSNALRDMRKRWLSYLVALLLLLVCRGSDRMRVSDTIPNTTPTPADLFYIGTTCDLCDDKWYQYVPSAPDPTVSPEPAIPGLEAMTTTTTITTSRSPEDAGP